MLYLQVLEHNFTAFIGQMARRAEDVAEEAYGLLVVDGESGKSGKTMAFHRALFPSVTRRPIGTTPRLFGSSSKSSQASWFSRSPTQKA